MVIVLVDRKGEPVCWWWTNSPGPASLQVSAVSTTLLTGFSANWQSDSWLTWSVPTWAGLFYSLCHHVCYGDMHPKYSLLTLMISWPLSGQLFLSLCFVSFSLCLSDPLASPSPVCVFLCMGVANSLCRKRQVIPLPLINHSIKPLDLQSLVATSYFQP